MILKKFNDLKNIIKQNLFWQGSLCELALIIFFFKTEYLDVENLHLNDTSKIIFKTKGYFLTEGKHM